jgi:hypothetical protein
VKDFICRALCAAALLIASSSAFADPTKGSVIVGLTSTRDHGTVSIMSDPVLSDGRLILKVVALNSTSAPSQFGPADIVITTAADKPVGIVSLERLIANVTGAKAPPADTHNPGSYSGPVMGHDANGKLDVSNYTGGTTSPDTISPHTQATNVESARKQDPATQAQVDNLKAAILQPMTIEPAKAAGGQVVTEKLKFGRKETAALKVVVQFNGESHEFAFDVPPAR